MLYNSDVILFANVFDDREVIGKALLLRVNNVITSSLLAEVSALHAIEPYKWMILGRDGR